VRDASMIGIISDTHGLIRPESLAALRGSDLIIHAGDVGESTILEQLGTIAPIVAVRGNIDKAPWTARLQVTAVVKAGSANIYVLHDIHDLDFDPAIAKFNIVVSGHSHKPAKNVQSGVLYVNPGSAGPRRFRLPVTVARLNLGRAPWTVDFIDLLTTETRSP
jgi:putative phosphoesterase